MFLYHKFSAIIWYFSATEHEEDVDTSSVDNEHELLTEVARVRSLPEGFHH